MFGQRGDTTKINLHIFLQVYFSFPLFGAGKKSRTLHRCPASVQACWLWGEGDRWHHNNSSPGHLSPRRLTQNGSSPLSYDPLTPIRHSQGDAQLPPLWGCLSPADRGCHCWQLSGQVWKTPIPNELQLFFEKSERIWICKNQQGVSAFCDFAVHRKSSMSSFRANGNIQRAHVIIAAAADSRKSFWGLFPVSSECICRRKISWKERKRV